MKRKPIRSHRELEVYQLAFEVAMRIFELYDHILGKLVNMIRNPSPWLMTKGRGQENG